jgi:hypothetical protein
MLTLHFGLVRDRLKMKTTYTHTESLKTLASCCKTDGDEVRFNLRRDLVSQYRSLCSWFFSSSPIGLVAFLPLTPSC